VGTNWGDGGRGDEGGGGYLGSNHIPMASVGLKRGGKGPSRTALVGLFWEVPEKKEGRNVVHLSFTQTHFLEKDSWGG